MSLISRGMAHEISQVRSIEMSRPRHESMCRGLVLISAVALFLHDAGTVGVSYTLRISYALMALACMLGARFVVRGWQSAPAGVKLTASFLVLVYLVSGLVGINPVLPGQSRGSSLRWVVYILDLGLGLASFGLLLGLFHDKRRIRHLAFALALGAVAAALYGLYQWFAQHYGLPFSNLDNAPNSEGLTVGTRFQGIGLLGWERVRGTFVEPFSFGVYLAAILPLVTQLPSGQVGRRRRCAWAAVAVTIGALVLTDSSLAWACLIAAVAVVGTGACINAGRPVLAGLAGGGVVLLVVMCTLFVAEPDLLSPVTARSDSQLHLTVSARTTAWSRATDTWSRHPVVGYGPGASSVKLAYRPNAQAAGLASAPVVLGSAQGIWAASLIDAGVFGVLAWIIMFGAVFYHTGSVVMEVDSPLLWAAIVAALVSVLASQVGGDRLDLHVWVLMAFALVVSQTARNGDRAADTTDSTPP
jgi:O-Antigen ligase